MGIFDMFKRKTRAEKNLIFFQKLRKQTIVSETKSVMHEVIISDEHDSSGLDQDPNGEGEFGLVKTNPIPVYGIDNIPAYMDKLRYEYTSKSGSGTTTYNQVDFVRTTDTDQSSIGSKKPTTEPVASSTSSPNINGHIDVYNLYSVGDAKLAKVYVNCYSLKTSNKIIDGFFHRDEVPAEKDSKVLLEAMKHMEK
jgi:hypothetical protein